MLKIPIGRFIFALLVVTLLSVIGRNLYRRALNHRLIAAVESRNVAAARSLLDRGADPNTLKPLNDGTGREVPALELGMNAVSYSSAQEIVCLLLQHGATARLNAPTLHNYLLRACQSGMPALARCLLEHGADANAGNANDSYDSVVDRAIEYASLTSPDIVIPYHPAAWSADTRLKVEKDRKQHRAVSRELVQLLKAHGAHLSLWQAARADDVESLCAALDSGAAIDAREPSTTVISSGSGKLRALRGPTALTLAAQAGSMECTRLLLQRGANVNVLSDYTASALDAAIRAQHLDIARLLLQRGADVNIKGGSDIVSGSSPLVSACNALPQIVPELLRRGADVKPVSNAALTAAIESKHPEVVTLLMQHFQREGIKPGPTALQTAIGVQPDLVPLLLARGADAHETLQQTDSLIWSAVSCRHAELIAPLVRAGANINGRHTIRGGGTLQFSTGDSGIPSALDDTTPLVEAAGKNPAAVKLLLDSGADPNVPDSRRQTPLIVAAQTGNIEAIPLLLKHGADVNQRDIQKHTPFHYARRHHHPEVAALLEKAGGKEE